MSTNLCVPPSSPSKTPAILGGVLGSLAAILLVMSATLLWRRRQRPGVRDLQWTPPGAPQTPAPPQTAMRTRSPFPWAIPTPTDSLFASFMPERMGSTTPDADAVLSGPRADLSPRLVVTDTEGNTSTPRLSSSNPFADPVTVRHELPPPVDISPTVRSVENPFFGGEVWSRRGSAMTGRSSGIYEGEAETGYAL
ncbi:hypothetical protein OBBRIDRAFT_593469 [Obba rivulosa]|uniref:Uncharacterized protein n=1 Tax=Obba rivulosa TaxID=1052685 RepID=A0A8E2ATY2_9APHY|nr:hypothetical protein OBBRIDRAFT_593469 [Obba rivulosa]